MNILFLGDVTGKSGRVAVRNSLSSLQEQYNIDFTIVNAENSAHGKGITLSIYKELTQAGANVLTLGNHAFSKGEILNHLDECPNLVRPMNMEPKDAGHSYWLQTVHGKRVAVINLLGTIFLDIAKETPFECMNRFLASNQADIIFVDLHAEATSEKQLFFQYFKEKVTAVIGTHTHVQTADERVLDGCAFMCDAGMCGPYDSILGRDTQEAIHHTVFQERTHFIPAEGDAMICGCVVTVDDTTNRATSIQRIQIRPTEKESPNVESL